ncbi:discoidin domain-containing protein [Diplocloster hominis]|uniref:discoidin domain-containing protein n=1 Tax=Diplocloster hominis TaxID=3079010 RepID=UPI0031B9C64E
MVKVRWKKLIVMLMVISLLPWGTVQAKAKGNAAPDNWEQLKGMLAQYGGTWEQPDFSGAITNLMPTTALLGNGDMGAVSYGNSREKTYLITKGDFWNCGDLSTNQLSGTNPKRISPLTVGGLSIREKSGEDISLEPTVTACGFIDDSDPAWRYKPEGILDGKMSADNETWACKENHGVSGEHWFQIDLKQIKKLSSYTLYHQGAFNAAGSAHNTVDFTVKISTNGEDWTEVQKVNGNTSKVTQKDFDEPVEAKYVRVEITKPSSRDHTARIPEMKLVTEEVQVSVDACGFIDDPNPNWQYKPTGIIDGKWSADNELWACKENHGTLGEHHFTIDLGSERVLKKYTIYHQGTFSSASTDRNTRDFTVSVSTNKEQWTEIENVTGNEANETTNVLPEAVRARYVKVHVTDPAAREGDETVRICEMKLYDDEGTNLITGEKSDSAFQEHQDITNGVLTTDMTFSDVPVTMNTLVSANENLMITEVTSNGDHPIELESEIWTNNDVALFPTESNVDGNRIWAARKSSNQAKENEISWTSEVALYAQVLNAKNVQAVKCDESGSKLTFTLEPGNTVYLVTSAGGGGKTYNHLDELAGPDPKQEAADLLDRAGTEDAVADIRQNSFNWWQDYWMKSYINIGDDLLQKYYYGSLYQLGAGARGDKLPPGIFGIWNTTDGAMWNGDYHMNYNYIAPFYGIYSSNRCEIARSVKDPLLDYMEEGKRRAKTDIAKIFPNYINGGAGTADSGVTFPGREDLKDGIDDAVLYPVSLGPWGTSAWQDANGGYLMQMYNAPFSSQAITAYYTYTQDAAYLQEVYPLLLAEANFFEKWCEKEELDSGEYRYNIWTGAHEDTFDLNAPTATGTVKNILSCLLEGTKAGAIDPPADKVAVWEDMYQHMADIPIETYTNGSFSKPVIPLSEKGVKLWPGSATVNLEFIHPGEQLNFDSSPELLEAARNSVEQKELVNSNIWNQINNTPKIYVQAIRAGYSPSYVMEKFKTHLNAMEKNFAVVDGYHGIEKAGGIEFINNMLLQSADGIIKVFPNWTGADAGFTSLREKGAYLVSSSLTNQTVDYVDIISETGNPIQLICPWEGAQVTDENGGIVEFEYLETGNSKEKYIKFQAEAGKSYHVIQGDTPVVPDKTALQDLYNSSLEKNEETYTGQSWLDLIAAREEAENVLSNQDADRDMITAAYDKLVEAIQALIERADLTELQGLYDQHLPKLDEEKYTQDSRNILREALENAANIIGKGIEAGRKEAQEAAAGIRQAVLDLEFQDIDYEALQEKIKGAEEIPQDKLTAGSLEKLLAALEEAKKIVPEAAKEELWNAVNSLMSVVNELEYMADLKGLQALYDKLFAESGTWTDYTDETVAILQGFMTQAEALLSRTDLTSKDQANIDDIAAKLEQSAKGLILKPADKAVLEEAIYRAESIDYTIYTSSSVSKVSAKLKAAKELFINTELTIRDQQKVQDMADQLNIALDALDKRADKAALNKQIARAESLSKDEYTANSWKLLSDALEAARNIHNDDSIGESGQDRVDQAVQQLTDAIDGLKKKPLEPEPTPTVKPEPSVQLEIQHGNNVPALNLGKDADLSRAFLSEEEQKMMAQGVSATVRILIENANTKAEELEQLNRVLGENNLADIWNIQILKRIGNGQESGVHILNHPIRFTLEIPENLRTGTASRKFYLYHLTETGIDILEDLDQDANTITVESGEFSLYALVYKDDKQKEETTDDKPVSNDSGSGDNSAVDPAQTADNSPLLIYIILMAISILAAAACYITRKSHKIKEKY